MRARAGASSAITALMNLVPARAFVLRKGAEVEVATADVVVGDIAAVVHSAAHYDFFGKPSSRYDEVTVDGTRRWLHGLRAEFEVEQFIFSSTRLVHRPGEFLIEDWPLGGAWAYPESKVRTEALIRAERGGIPAVILHFAGVYDDVCHSPPLAHQMPLAGAAS